MIFSKKKLLIFLLAILSIIAVYFIWQGAIFGKGSLMQRSLGIVGRNIETEAVCVPVLSAKIENNTNVINKFINTAYGAAYQNYVFEIVDEDGRATAAIVELYNEQGTTRISSTSADAGEAAVRIPPGNYLIRATETIGREHTVNPNGKRGEVRVSVSSSPNNNIYRMRIVLRAQEFPVIEMQNSAAPLPQVKDCGTGIIKVLIGNLCNQGGGIVRENGNILILDNNGLAYCKANVQNGAFELFDIPNGRYRITAGDKTLGIGGRDFTLAPQRADIFKEPQTMKKN